MATITDTSLSTKSTKADEKSPQTLGDLVDRWIFVFMAGLLIAVTLTGFIPDSTVKIQAVQQGERPPFPMILHVHAVLMGSFLLLLLFQTWLAATGRKGLHMQTGVLGFILVPALVVVGFLLAPVMYQELWTSWQSAPPEARAKAEEAVLRRENVLLAQTRIGILFPLIIGVALWARRRDSGVHKRLMILGTASMLPPALSRMTWLPTTLPENYISNEFYILLAISPMLIWDIVRNGKIHKAYWIWVGITAPVAVALYSAWDTPWWHEVARRFLTD